MTIIKDVTGDYVAAVAIEAEWKNPNGIIITVPKEENLLIKPFLDLKGGSFKFNTKMSLCVFPSFKLWELVQYMKSPGLEKLGEEYNVQLLHCTTRHKAVGYFALKIWRTKSRRQAMQ